jgi:hypothetical protein
MEECKHIFSEKDLVKRSVFGVSVTLLFACFMALLDGAREPLDT